ncbi:MAG TPA: MBOAT family O-acyltransferase [Planctomycetota bacterium]|nr:MBOAT family O-acyltransferase [Planctomycetota bacterium]
MLFHTWVFAVFFLVVYPVFLLVKNNNRAMNVWLMIASYVFYGWWNPSYLLLLFATSAIDYLMVVFMEKSASKRTRKLWLIVSLVSNFGFLAFFKYSHFITDNINWIFEHFHWALRLPDPVAYPNAALSLFGVKESHLFAAVVLPIGISFHTFQSMSYTIDAYYGNIQTERSFVRFLTFVSFFPQLVAGPIERASNLLPQLQGRPVVSGDDIVNGLSLFLVGFFKKVALADYLALYVDKVYSAPGSFQSGALVLATVAFAWQIYFDFSGYTDMARGLAQIMGFRLMLNFNNPYVATGLGDFWSRWHISLSTWFKDYVYFPLGGNRKGKGRTYFNMFVTMLISGIWHGAAWTFVVWGLLHAIGRIVTRELEGTTWYRERIPRFIKQVLVFSFVCLAWIFFRAPTMTDAWLVLSRIFTTSWGDPQFPVVMGALIVAVWFYEEFFSRGARTRSWLEGDIVRVGMAAAMVLWLAVVAQPSTQSFIYFQF